MQNASPPFTPGEIQRLVDDWFGRLSPDQSAGVQSWLAEDETRRQAAEVLWNGFSGGKVSVHPDKTEIFVASAMAAIRKNRHVSAPSHPAMRHKSSRWFGMAAVAGVLAFAAFGVRQFVLSSEKTPFVQYTTGQGEQKTVTLSDGSRVTLAPRSSLSVDNGFGTTDRAVSLTGEAHFEVIASSGAPFIVHGERGTTRVLGTSFVVRDYPGASAVVAVLSGKVEFQSGGGKALLSGGMAGVLQDSVANVMITQDSEQYAGWRDGRLIFRGTPVTQVLASLERWYGYTFQLSDSTLATRRVTAMFDIANSQETFAALTRLLNVAISVSDSVVVLTPRPPGSREAPEPYLVPRKDSNPFIPRIGVGQ